MRLAEIKGILNATVLWGEDKLDREVFSACGSDFMSDVLAFVKNQALLLTGLVNPQEACGLLYSKGLRGNCDGDN